MSERRNREKNYLQTFHIFRMRRNCEKSCASPTMHSLAEEILARHRNHFLETGNGRDKVYSFV